MRAIQYLLRLFRRFVGTQQILDQLISPVGNARRAPNTGTPEILSPHAVAPSDLEKGAIIAICRADADSDFACVLNGYALELPGNTIKTMIHCLSISEQAELTLRVETAHIAWMMERLTTGGVFIDVGAATGAATLPIAIRFGDGVKIVAFEPARKARSLLERACKKNHILSVTVVDQAVSDSNGNVSFVEYGADASGRVPYLPECSSIQHSHLRNDAHSVYEVTSITLDSYFSRPEHSFAERSPVVIKIDVEGFEESVIRGCGQLIRGSRPYFAVDIHGRVDGGPGDTESGCQELLSTYGYSFSRLGHVMLCTPSDTVEAATK